MTPVQGLAVEALRVFAWGVPPALGYLAIVQWRRHRGSALALGTVGLAIAAWALVTGGTVSSVQGGALAGAGLAVLAALGWKLALRRRPGFRDGETLGERLLPMLIAGDLMLVLFTWPALAALRAELTGV